MTATVTPIDPERRERARASIAAAAADAVAAATEAQAVVTQRLSTRSPGRRRILEATGAFLRLMAQRVGDEPSAEERAWALRALQAAQRVRDELRRTSAELARASQRRDRGILERALDVPAETAAAVAAEVSRTLGSLADRVERATTTVASSAVDAWGSVVPTIGLGGIAIVAVLAYVLFKR